MTNKENAGRIPKYRKPEKYTEIDIRNASSYSLACAMNKINQTIETYEKYHLVHEIFQSM